MAAKLPIPLAKLVSCKSHVVPGQLLVTEYYFEVPLDYANPDGQKIQLFARGATKNEKPIVPSDEAPTPRPWLVFLQGGPGHGCPQPQDFSLTRQVISRGYQILYLDHRGTGQSTPVSARMLQQLPGGVDGQVNYLRLMRQDNTVRDNEAVRKYLTQGLSEEKARWSTFGQSYGGFVNLTYLSMHPEGLREVFFTGGLAPIGKSADQVYETTFGRVANRSAQYYTKFPEDVENLHQIATYIEGQGGSIPMPGGGKLTVPRLLTMGIAFGVHNGFDMVHGIVLRLKSNLDQLGFIDRSVLTSLESFTDFDAAIIYAVLHEAIYCDGPGVASNWAAQRVGQRLDNYFWLQPGAKTATYDKPLYFSGEMIFPLHFETYPELQVLSEVADKLAKISDWAPLYDKAQLAENKVPCYAASYVDDMFVDYNYANDTANLVKGTKVFAINTFYHNAVRAKGEEVFQQLMALRDDVID